MEQSKLLFLCVVCLLISCNRESGSKGTEKDGAGYSSATPGMVTVYYFHSNRKCPTCIMVEKIAGEVVAGFPADKVRLMDINREDDSGNPLIEKYRVSGQTLLVVMDDRVVNMTNEAFLLARQQPDQVRKSMRSVIEKMLQD